MARATVFCVGTTGATCTVTSAGSAANLQGALTSAQGGGADTIRIGPGTFTSPTDDGFTYAADQSISIDGSGASTILQLVAIGAPPDGAAGGGGGPGAADLVAPVLGRLSMLRRRFRVAARRTPVTVARRRPAGHGRNPANSP
jgi:hypothetical protein